MGVAVGSMVGLGWVVAVGAVVGLGWVVAVGLGWAGTVAVGAPVVLHATNKSNKLIENHRRIQKLPNNNPIARIGADPTMWALAYLCQDHCEGI